jgi:hypothetical protein
MAPTPAQPPLPSVPSTPPPGDARYDELTGVYGFFRRHQKKLLYTAGLFTLLTFSISAPMMAAIGDAFADRAPMPTIVVNGTRLPLQPEDYEFGTVLAQNAGTAIPFGVMPPVNAGEGGGSELGDVLAVLRRAAIAEGIDASYAEVDAAIESVREAANAATPAKLASDRGFPSLARYREVMYEAMRVGTYIRLQTLAVDATEPRVLQLVLADKEKITLRVATLDEKVLEDQLKAAAPIGDADLQAWLDAKSEVEQGRIGIFDLPRAELRFVGLMLAEGQFNPEQWKDDYLKDFTVTDDQLKAEYEREKVTRMKVAVDTVDGAKPDDTKPFDDAAKLELTRLMQAEQVMNKLLAAARQKQNDVLKPANEELIRIQGEVAEAESALATLEKALSAKEGELKAKQAELAQKPDDATLKEAVATLTTAGQQAKDAAFAARDVVPAKKAAATVAEDAVKAARLSFDLSAWIVESTKDKSGFVTKAMTGMKNADELKDLDAPGLELGFGTWTQAAQGTRLQNKGDLGFATARTSKAVVIYQATDVQPRPRKTPEQIKPLAEGAYWTEQAKKQSEDKRKLMEDALLRLAKAKIPEVIADLEGKKSARIDEKVAEFERKTRDEIAEAEKTLAKPGLGENAAAPWRRKLESRKAALAAIDQQRQLFTADVQRAIDGEVAEAAKKHYGEVLEAAAAEAGFTVTSIGPFRRELQREPRFDKAFDATVVYLFRNQSELKEGESTGLLYDAASRRAHVAACTKVEPLTAADVKRRDFESLRTGDGAVSFANTQAYMSYQQAFTRELIEQRYELQRPVGEQRDAKAAEPPKTGN